MEESEEGPGMEGIACVHTEKHRPSVIAAHDGVSGRRIGATTGPQRVPSGRTDGVLKRAIRSRMTNVVL